MVWSWTPFTNALNESHCFEGRHKQSKSQGCKYIELLSIAWNCSENGVANPGSHRLILIASLPWHSADLSDRLERLERRHSPQGSPQLLVSVGGGQISLEADD